MNCKISGAFGGVIGLCNGFSFMSGIQFVYFFTVRYWVDLYRSKKAKKKPDEASPATAEEDQSEDDKKKKSAW